MSRGRDSSAAGVVAILVAGLAAACNGDGSTAARAAGGPQGDPRNPGPVSHGAFLVERVHVVDPKAEEARFSADNVTRPLWLGGEEMAVVVTGAAQSGVEFELASTPTATELPGARLPKKVEVAFVTSGGSRSLAVAELGPLSPGKFPWRRYRADLAGTPAGSGRFEIAVDGKPAGKGSAWLVSIPRIVQQEDAQSRPNVLLITIDTLRADYLHCYGHDRPTSPCIDAIAKEGILFERAVSQAPWTLPSYSSTFSGLYAESHGVVMRDHRFGGRFVTFIEELAQAGYTTGGIVSGTFTDAFWGFDQGFDSYDDLGMVVDETQLDKVAAAGGAAPSAPAAMHANAEERITSPDVSARACDWLEAHRDRRFALLVHFFDPHSTFMPHPGISEQFPPRPAPADFPNPADTTPAETAKQRALYEGEIAFTDQHIGKVLDKLAQLGLADETIVVVFADHGEAFKEHVIRRDDDSKNLGHGSTLFNEQVHVPLIFRVPGVSAARVSSPVGNLDIGPTLLELCNVGPTWQPQGVSLVPMLHDKEAARESPVLSALFQAMPAQGATLNDRVQAIHRLDGGDDCAIEWFPHPVTRDPGARFLFDWATNPWQDPRQNLVEKFKAKFEQMMQLYHGRLRPALEQLLTAPDVADTNEDIRNTLHGLGYTSDDPAK